MLPHLVFSAIYRTYVYKHCTPLLIIWLVRFSQQALPRLTIRLCLKQLSDCDIGEPNQLILRRPIVVPNSEFQLLIYGSVLVFWLGLKVRICAVVYLFCLSNYYPQVIIIDIFDHAYRVALAEPVHLFQPLTFNMKSKRSANCLHHNYSFY